MDEGENIIREFAHRVSEQRKNFTNISNLNDEEISDALELEVEYFQMLADTVNETRDKEIENAWSGKKFTKEEKAYLKKYEDELASAVKEFKKLNKSGYFDTKSDEILEWAEEPCSKSEHKENLSDAFEEYKYRIDEYYCTLGYDREFGEPTTEHDWTVFIKRPKKNQLEAAIAALDEQQPEWTTKGEYFEMKALISTLLHGFPELVKKNAPLKFLESKGVEPPSTSGCLSLIISGGLAISYIGLKSLGII